MNKQTLLAISTAFCLLHSVAGNAQKTRNYSVTSPDGSTRLEAAIGQQGQLQYRMLYAGNQVLDWSPMGFSLNTTRAGSALAIASGKRSVHKESIAWPLGESDHIDNNYGQLLLNCTASGLRFQVEARVFDGSIAFRYLVPEQPGLSAGFIQEEKTAFNLTRPYTLYQYHHESVFSPVRIDTFNTPCDLPATLASEDGYLSIGEAENTAYTKAELKRGTAPNSLAIAFVRDTAVKLKAAGFRSPWRTVSFSKTAIGLHRFSDLFLRLNPAGNGAQPSVVKPGKLIRSQLTTASGLACIDFAAAHNLQYILFDAGWYGAEFRSTSDPTQVIPAIDLPQVIAHGKEKGIGVLLYVNYVGLRQKLDTLLPLYKKWGVAGLKFGFVDGFRQEGLSWLAGAIKKVNDYGFVLDIHDNYKPTGLSRTYPFLLTQEGIRGDENSPDAFHTTVLPFTRFLAGPADFTFCYPNSKNKFSKNIRVSMAQQLALTVVYFSPLQSLFWYGRPEDYTNEGEIAFFTQVPTVWNESRYLAGDIGKGICVARRSGERWFVGSACGLEDWKQNIVFDFLPRGKTYTATIYEDDGQGSIRKSERKVKKGDILPLDLKATAGQALILEPAEGALSLKAK